MAVTAADAAAPTPSLVGEPPPAASGGAVDRRRVTLQAAWAQIEADEQAEREQAAERERALAEDAERGRAPHGRPPKDPQAALERARARLQAALARERRDGDASSRRRVRKARAALEQAEQRAREHASEPDRVRLANVTDPDSRIMPVSGGGWVQGYNAQAIATPGGIVLACHVSQSTVDTPLYQPMTDTLAHTLTAAAITDPVGLVLADAGYWSHANAAARGPDRLIATTSSYKQRQAARQHGPASGPPPDDATPEQAMQHRLRTPEGAAAYKQRSATIEPIFGERKHNHGMRGFRRRGLGAANSEWALMNLAHNLLKLRGHRQATATA